MNHVPRRGGNSPLLFTQPKRLATTYLSICK
uniref:Uncharacterized protein n=1 Tax=Heterorhabditis bacteriophora TaxID=37862 RepID=A0A1I7X003_HETBA